MNKNYISISITSNDLDKRIDLLLSLKFKRLSRNRIQNLILNGNVIFNKKIISQPSIKLKECGKLVLTMPEPEECKVNPQELDINIIFEDENLIVVNKKPGMVVHPGAGNKENTLVNALLYHCKNNLSGIGGILRPGVVHRIDKMTSGLLVLAKNDLTHQCLSQQFKDRTIKREYSLLSWNLLPKNNGIIETKISRSKFNRKKMAISNSDKGKKAITKYKLIQQFSLEGKLKISHLKCVLMTGRTHQIRVHMNHIGNPIIGDRKYGKNNHYKLLPENLRKIIFCKFINIQRHALHARTLGFYHPVKKKDVLFESDLPDDFKSVLKILKVL
ncbi:MAG: RluA family pseudouridine synthase [Pseudomonadota bacterium]|nr:RluA family pseudouridine synthase [Pseudomonadota bacterium]